MGCGLAGTCFHEQQNRPLKSLSINEVGLLLEHHNIPKDAFIARSVNGDILSAAETIEDLREIDPTVTTLYLKSFLDNLRVYKARGVPSTTLQPSQVP